MDGQPSEGDEVPAATERREDRACAVTRTDQRGAKATLGLRRCALALLAALCACCGASALAVPALAAGQPGHVFTFTFGEQGTGPGQFDRPAGVAVSTSSGDVYVSDDAGGGRLEEFEPVLNAAGELEGEKFLREVKVPSAGALAVDNCSQEVAGAIVPCTSVEDPSVGDVYVLAGKKAGESPRILDKFKPGLEPVTGIKPKGSPIGVAVAPNGTLSVLDRASREIQSFSDAEPNAQTAKLPVAFLEPAPAFAADAVGNFYIAHVPDGEEFATGSPQAVLSDELTPPHSELEQEQRERGLGVLGELEAHTGAQLVNAFSDDLVSAVALEPVQKDLYAADVATVANQTSSTVAVFSAAAREGGAAEAGQLIERLVAPGLQEAAGVAVSPTSGAVYVADAGSNRVYVFASEERAKSLTHGKPKIDGVSAESAPGDAIELKAQVSAAGSETSVHFEYGEATCPTGCTSTPSSAVPAGYGAQEVSIEAQGVPAGAYDYRVVAENAGGNAVSAPQTFSLAGVLGALPDGRQWELVSPPEKGGAEPEAMNKEGGLIQAAENGDAITYVANGVIPAGSEVEGARGPELNQILSSRNPTWSSHDINTPNTTGSGPKIGRPPEYQAFSSNLSLALVRPPVGDLGRLASPPIAPPLPGEAGAQENTFYLHGDMPAPGTSENLFQPGPAEKVSYERARENGEKLKEEGIVDGDQGFLALVNKDSGLEDFGESQNEIGLFTVGRTADLSHVVFKSNNPPTKGLYEWSEPAQAPPTGQQETAKLTPVSVLPADEGGTFEIAGQLGSADASANTSARVQHAISEDGTLVFWHSGKGHLFVRDTETGETLGLSASGAVADDANFMDATPDGSQVFFTDGARLTADSKASENAPDLYVAHVKLTGGHLSSELTDLTAQRRESAGVVGTPKWYGLIGIGEPSPSEAGPGERGPYAYFVANAALAPGAHRGLCNPNNEGVPAATTCNLYVRHYDEASESWEPTKLIAALSFEDAPDWGGLATAQGDLQKQTARVSPNGRYLAFMSKRSLTGYDNIDVNEAEGLHADEEVYLYNGAAQNLTCASCNPSGARPAGIFNPGPFGTTGRNEGLGLVVDRDGVWGEKTNNDDHWLAGSVPGWTQLENGRALYQPRYLSNSGRLFFDSPDHLVPAATGSKEKVYEYEPGAVGGCHSSGGCVGLISSGTSAHESAFLDASANGDDVFFLTDDQLTSQDKDETFDIYDAHVCSEASPCVPPPPPPPAPCEGSACQGSFELLPSASASGTSVSGAGNVLLAGGGVLGTKTTVPPPSKPPARPLTRAQKLKRALAACKKDKAKSKRLACEKQARKKYGPLKAKAKRSSGSGR